MSGLLFDDLQVGHVFRHEIRRTVTEAGAGVVGIDGKMFDIPHLRQAEQVLSRAAAFAQRQG